MVCSGDCVADFRQCAGKGFSAPRSCCNEDFDCFRKNASWSQCRRASTVPSSWDGQVLTCTGALHAGQHQTVSSVALTHRLVLFHSLCCSTLLVCHTADCQNHNLAPTIHVPAALPMDLPQPVAQRAPTESPKRVHPLVRPRWCPLKDDMSRPGADETGYTASLHHTPCNDKPSPHFEAMPASSITVPTECL